MQFTPITALCLGSLALAGTANAQDVQNFEPAAGTWNYLSVESAQTAPQGAFVPSLYINYGRNPIARRDADSQIVEEFVSHMTTVDLLAVYGVTDWLDVSLALPFSMIGGGAGLDGIGYTDGFTLHDVRLTPKARLYDTQMFKFAVALPMSAPTGDANKFASDDTVTVHPKALGELFFGGTRAALNLGYKYRAENPTIGPLELGNEITYGAAVSHDLHAQRLFALAEVFGAVPAESVNDADSSRPLEALIGARYHTDWCGVFTGGAGLGIVGDYGSPQYRALAGFAWQCPPVPEAKPEPEPEPKAEPKPEPSDRDQDGLLDADDTCPDAPEDKDGFEDADGCPDPDNDKDGIKDADDACPLKAEDKDNFEDADGCPDLDNDKDGILDTKDACPLQAEVINGFEDEDGCPDESKVKVTAKKLEVLERIYFAFSSDKIDPRSFSVLNQIAAALNAHPEITKVRIEGHTDSKGSKKVNKALSSRRAAAVRTYLVNHKVANERLVAKGYGSSRPLWKQGSKGAAQKNRRVEFIILKSSGTTLKDTSSK